MNSGRNRMHAHTFDKKKNKNTRMTKRTKSFWKMSSDNMLSCIFFTKHVNLYVLRLRPGLFCFMNVEEARTFLGHVVLVECFRNFVQFFRAILKMLLFHLCLFQAWKLPVCPFGGDVLKRRFSRNFDVWFVFFSTVLILIESFSSTFYAMKYNIKKYVN